jgi:hypothetical protein
VNELCDSHLIFGGPLADPVDRHRLSVLRRPKWKRGKRDSCNDHASTLRQGADGLLNIDAIADAYWHLHTQHPSAWTHELDLRPFKEAF